MQTVVYTLLLVVVVVLVKCVSLLTAWKHVINFWISTLSTRGVQEFDQCLNLGVSYPVASVLLH